MRGSGPEGGEGQGLEIKVKEKEVGQLEPGQETLSGVGDVDKVPKIVEFEPNINVGEK